MAGSLERQMVAGTVATKENPQTGEKRREVSFPEKKRKGDIFRETRGEKEEKGEIS